MKCTRRTCTDQSEEWQVLLIHLRYRGSLILQKGRYYVILFRSGMEDLCERARVSWAHSGRRLPDSADFDSRRFCHNPLELEDTLSTSTRIGLLDRRYAWDHKG